MITKEHRDAIRERLAELELAGGGRLTPSAVVADARDPDSPLHKHFQWDVQKAAESFWLDQARALITSVHVVIKTERALIRTVYYVRDPTADVGEQGYVGLPRLRSDTELARETLLAEFGRVADMLRRARELAAVLGAADEVESLLAGVVGLRNSISAQPAQAM